MTRWARLTPILLLGVCAAEATAAQAIRINGVSSVRYLDARPLIDDSVAAADALGSGLLRRSAEGYVVRCVDGDPVCRFRRPAERTSTVPAFQDLTMNLWGFGRGVRVYSRLRVRATVAGESDLWPRGDDRGDLLAAFVEFERSMLRVRAGRQWSNDLGYRNYDGASLRVRPLNALTLEGYGGRSLAIHLNEPLTSDELLNVEQLAPETGASIWGARVMLRPSPALTFAAAYQREVRTDELGLYSERAALDANLRFGSLSASGVIEVDWARWEVNEGALRLWYAGPANTTVSAFARHYHPFFELWTIWGAFSPFDYDEVGVGVSWASSTRRLILEASSAARWYVDPVPEPLFGDVRSQGWRISLAAIGRPGSGWTVHGRYGVDVGFGSSRSDINAQLRRELGRGYLAGTAGSFQRLYELRLDEGSVWTVGARGGYRIGSDFAVHASVHTYRHSATGQAVTADWTQFRGDIRFEWTVGHTPRITVPPLERIE